MGYESLYKYDSPVFTGQKSSNQSTFLAYINLYYLMQVSIICAFVPMGNSICCVVHTYNYSAEAAAQ